MEPMHEPSRQPRPSPRIDWEAFYTHYRKPGYVPGFEIVNKLGGGVFGMVFKARKESIGKDYAIKFLKVDDEVVRDAVVREIESVRYFAQVDHPNLVSIEDKGEVDGIPFIIMSYAGEETLRKRIEDGQLSREDALRIFAQVARGIFALHERSLVHFDIKPANVFLKGDIARVGDYGLSKLVTESRNSLSFGRGTPYYMAPEMLKRRGDHRSDIYSLGILLFECLTGDVPFKGESEWEVLRKHEHEAPNFPASMAAADRRVIERCLRKDPLERYASVADLLRDLQAPAALGESFVLPSRDASPRASERAAEATAHEPPPLPHRHARDPERSPYSMPWMPQERRPRTVLQSVVAGVLWLLQGVVFVLLAPARVLSVGLGRLLAMLLQLPLRILALAMSLFSYLLVAFVLLMVVFALISLFGRVV
jgi:serine/threonine protein kinase